jgi:formylglycine-generating enzyme required for sulfatase activity
VRVIEETVRLGRCRDHGVLGPGLVSILTATLPSAGTHPVLDLPTRSMVLIPAGTSAMKSAQVHSNQPRHETPSRHFSLGMFPVTQEQRATLAQGTNSSHFKGGCRPVESVTWDDALRFCDALSRFAGFVPV